MIQTTIGVKVLRLLSELKQDIERGNKEEEQEIRVKDKVIVEIVEDE